ncbi:MAG: iron-siderophore ABC transporter substrate-binding protein [Actinomycetota bacterium]|nr:iron-siderophore ABC transporter substrate-binding protein [Actinomycetota bacterium]
MFQLKPVAIASLAFAAFAACGGSDDAANRTAEREGAPAATTIEALAVPPPRPSSNPKAVTIASGLAPYERFGTDAAPGQFPRTIRHALGETRIERAPARVVTLDTGELDTMVELGIKPVGVVDYGADGLPAYFDPKEIEGVQVIGTIQEPNLEAIARLRPDLIVSSKLRHEKIYGQLAQIAPTVFAERPGVAWKQNFQLFAQAVGRENQAAATVERYQRRVAGLNEALPEPRPAVSVTRIIADGNIRLYQRANFLGLLLTDLGFPRPDPQNVDDFAAEVSLEQLDQADGDVIIVAVFDATKNTHEDAIFGSPVWKQLAAVKAGAVHTVDDQTWIGGIGYHAAFAVMDQIQELFT